MTLRIGSCIRLTRHLAVLAVATACCLALPADASAKADPDKVLRFALEAPDDGFNLVRLNTFYSNTLAEGIFETLLTYDYLARPARLVPNTAESLPEISADGKTYTFHVKKGIYFTPDPAFKGQKRELTAADYAYVIKRHLDPSVRSVHERIFRGKIVGMDAVIAKAKQTGKFDYDAPIEGLQTPDRYTLRLVLKDPDHNLSYQFTHPAQGAVAREVVEHYGEDALVSHPVGTGPYMLKEYVPRSKIVFVANPDWRGFVWDFKSSGDPWDEQLIRDMKGKQMPQIGRVEISIVEEEQARWLAFDSGQHDYAELAPPAAPKILDGEKLKPEIAKRGITLYRYVEPSFRYTYFNMNDPVVGGYTPEKIALRRALSMSYNYKDDIAHAWYGQAMRAHSIVPPGTVGYDPTYRSSIPYDPDLAAKLLDRFGYKKGADGWRTMPDGKPLVVKISSDPRSRDAAKREVWKHSLDKLGVHAEFPISSYADNSKAAYHCELQMWGLGELLVSVPDGIDSFEIFYGPNSYQGNFGCYRSKAYDEAYDQAMLLPAGPERDALYRKLERILEADTAISKELWVIRNWVAQPWVKGFKKHPNLRADWKYLDIDKH